MRALPGWQPGFSLVELMISMTISLVILAALVAVFVNTSGSNNEMAKANGLIENGRLAIQVLENDIVHGGFWGTAVPQFDNQTAGGIPADVPGAVPDPCLVYNPGNWTDAYKTDLIGIPVQADDTASFCTGVFTDKRDDSDVLVVRHAETCVAGSGGNCEADIAGKLYFQPSRCLTDLVFYALDTAGYTLLQRDCATVAEKRKFVSDLYYIRDYAVTAGDGIPTLMRSQFDLTPGGNLEHQGAVAMIEGIESLVVEFGIDDVSKTGAAVDYTDAINWDDPATRTTPTNRGDGAPDDDFVRCTTASPCTAAQLMNVTAVKLYVLARSRELTRGYTDTKTYILGSGTTLGPFNDGFKRHLFVTTVRLPNVSGRRMTP
jgi:type IV pilus assembly protein PilW